MRKDNMYPDYSLIDPKGESYIDINTYEYPHNLFYGDIDEGIRELVFMLRNEGINTTFSCAHDKTIQFEADHSSVAEIVYTLLFNHGFKNFKIEFTLGIAANGYPYRRGIVKFNEWR